MIHYDLIRTRRKTLAIYVKPEGKVEVRAPIRASKAYIDRFVQSKTDWISQTLERLERVKSNQEVINIKATDVGLYKKRAEGHLQERCRLFADIMGVRHRSLKVNRAKTRWGSCNAKGDLNFSYRTILLPAELIDYIVVHELAHIRELNHSSRFWAVVEEVMPDFRERRKRLIEFQKNFKLNEV